MDIHEHQQFRTSSLSKLFAAQKSSRSTCTSVIAGSRAHEPIHGITPDAGIRCAIPEFRDRSVGGAFENQMCLHVRPQRAFTLSDEVVDVRALRITIAHITPGPSGARHNLAIRANHKMCRWIVRHEPVVVVFHVYYPGQLELLEVVQADDGLGFGFSTMLEQAEASLRGSR